MANNLVQLIKRVAMDAVEASKPCTTYVGKVKKLSPLQITIGQSWVLDSDFLDITSRADEKMKKGSRVLMIRQAGGQKYTVVDTLK